MAKQQLCSIADHTTPQVLSWERREDIKMPMTTVSLNQCLCQLFTNNKNNPKLMWKTLKQILPSKTMSNVDPETISPDQFNDFFSNIGEVYPQI